MAISHRDFFRILPKAIGSRQFQHKDNIITVFVDEGEICITLSKERIRKIASLSLPITELTFQIKNVAKNTKDEFFKRFDRAYHRGGG